MLPPYDSGSILQFPLDPINQRSSPPSSCNQLKHVRVNKNWTNGRFLGRLVAPCYAKDCQLLHLCLWHSILFQTADAAINVLDSMLATSCLRVVLPIANSFFFNSTMCNHVGPWMWGETARNSPLAPANATANGVPDRQSLIARRGANAKRFQRASLSTQKELEPTSLDFQTRLGLAGMTSFHMGWKICLPKCLKYHSARAQVLFWFVLSLSLCCLRLSASA